VVEAIAHARGLCTVTAAWRQRPQSRNTEPQPGSLHGREDGTPSPGREEQIEGPVSITIAVKGKEEYDAILGRAGNAGT
jgi:hypothetical protein